MDGTSYRLATHNNTTRDQPYLLYGRDLSKVGEGGDYSHFIPLYIQEVQRNPGDFPGVSNGLFFTLASSDASRVYI